MPDAKGWYLQEVIGIGFAGERLHPASSMDEARALVSAGTHRWAMCHGSILALVPVEYELGRWEHFLIEQNGRFEEARLERDR